MYCLNCQAETEGSTICQYCGCTEKTQSPSKRIQNKTTYNECTFNYDSKPFSEIEKKRMQELSKRQELSERQLILIEQILHDTDMPIDKVVDAVCKVNPNDLPKIPPVKSPSEWEGYTKDEVKSKWDTYPLEPIPMKEKSRVDTWIETVHKQNQEREELRTHFKHVFTEEPVEQWNELLLSLKVSETYERCFHCIFRHKNYCVRHDYKLPRMDLSCSQYHPLDYKSDRQWHKDRIKEGIAWIVMSFLIGFIFIGPYLQQLGYF